MAIVTFVPKEFKETYPEFEGVANAPLNNYFQAATFHCDNSDNSFVQDVNARKYLLYLLTAHIATLRGAKDAGNTSAVGRVSKAKEGSVEADMEYLDNKPGNGPWYQQTQYGAEYWQATSKYRGFRYKIRQTVPW